MHKKVVLIVLILIGLLLSIRNTNSTKYTKLIELDKKTITEFEENYNYFLTVKNVFTNKMYELDISMYINDSILSFKDDMDLEQYKELCNAITKIKNNLGYKGISKNEFGEIIFLKEVGKKLEFARGIIFNRKNTPKYEITYEIKKNWYYYRWEE